MSESRRGCGYQKIGGLYLECDPGIQLVCDGLPLELDSCECCGFFPPFSRNLQRLNVQYIIQAERKKHNPPRSSLDLNSVCTCPPSCPICHPENQEIPSFGLMFVGKKYYTPESFIKEALEMGVSKRIPDIPHWMILGTTWIFLAHDEVPKVTLEQLKNNGMHMKEPEKSRAIFYGFKPQRIVMPMWKNEISEDEIKLLEKKGIKVKLLDSTPENRKKHQKAKSMKAVLRLLQPEPEEEPEE